MAEKKGAGGRPTKYKPEYVEHMLDWFKNHLGVPTFQQYAIEELNVNTDTLKEWRDVHPKFSATYKKCKEYQEFCLIEGNMTGEIKNSAFSIFMMKNCHGWTDKSEVKQDVKVTGAPSITFSNTTKKDEE